MNESTMLELMSMSSCYTAMAHLEDVIRSSAIPPELRECLNGLVESLRAAKRDCQSFVEAAMIDLGA